MHIEKNYRYTKKQVQTENKFETDYGIFNNVHRLKKKEKAYRQSKK